MNEKDVKVGLSKEAAKNFSAKVRVALTQGDFATLQQTYMSVMGLLLPQGLMAFPVETIPVQSQSVPQPAPSQPVMAPEQERLEKLYANVATNIWRIKNQLLAEDNSDGDGESYKETLDERAIGKIVRYINSLMTALENGGVEVVGDLVGKPHREGSAVKVVSYEDRQDLKRDEYVEVLMPTVRWTNSQGQTRLLQAAEVVVGRPKNSLAETETENA